MTHPLVDCESALVADLLAGTLEVVRENGGFIAPTTRLIERAGQLSVTSTADDDSPLFRIPRECFVRVDRVTWAEQEDRMVIVDVPEEFTDVETEMLYLQVALHNACDKLAWMNRTHPALDPTLPEDLVNAIQSLLPSFRNPMMAATDVLWANRCFRIPFSDDLQPERVLIPLVDLLNHHALGAVADWTGEDFMITTRKPFGTSECALDYGMQRTALEMAVVYGFFDPGAPLTANPEYDRDALRRIAEFSGGHDSTGSIQLLGRAAAHLLRD